MIEIIMYTISIGVIIILIQGAWLTIQDSEKLHEECKKVSKKNPKLTRLQVKVLARLNLKENSDE